MLLPLLLIMAALMVFFAAAAPVEAAVDVQTYSDAARSIPSSAFLAGNMVYVRATITGSDTNNRYALRIDRPSGDDVYLTGNDRDDSCIIDDLIERSYQIPAGASTSSDWAVELVQCTQRGGGGWRANGTETPSYFSIGYTVTTNSPLAATCGLDIALVLDRSGSINSTELGQMRTAFIALVNALAGTPTQFSVTHFGSSAYVQQTFTSDTSAVISAINANPDSIGSYTNWEDGIIKAQSTFPGSDKPNLMIFATDGDPTARNSGSSDLQAGIGAANAAKGAGTRILAFGVGGAPTIGNLQLISGPIVNGANIATTDVITSSFSDMANKLKTFATDTCGGTISVNKIIDPDGDPETTEGQTTSGDLVSGWDYTAAATGGTITPSSVTTGADGAGSSVFSVSPSETGSAIVTLTETVKSNYQFAQAVCTKQDGDDAGTDPDVIGTYTSNPFDVPVSKLDIVVCNFYNKPVPIEVTATKTWSGLGTNETAPALWFQLYEGTTAVGEPQAVPTGDLRTVTWSGLDETKSDGTPYEYTVAEGTVSGGTFTAGVPAGWTAENWSCEDNICTITNTRNTIGISATKTWSGLGETEQSPALTFQLFQGGTPYGESQSVQKTGPGDITVSWADVPETDPSGTAYVYSVKEGTGSGATFAAAVPAGFTADPASGECTVAGTPKTCTITNTRNTIGINATKAWVGTPADGTVVTFTLTNDKGLTIDPDTLTLTYPVLSGSFDDLPKYVVNAASGALEAVTYTVTETGVPTGYEASEACEIVSTDESLSCEITNTKQGSIVIEKQTLPDESSLPEDQRTKFTFSGDGITGANNTLTDGGKIVLSNLTPGTYQIQELVTAEDWVLTGITCSDTVETPENPMPSEPDLEDRSVMVNLDPDETVTCVFTNLKQVDISAKKVWLDGLEDTATRATVNLQLMRRPAGSTVAPIADGAPVAVDAASSFGPWTHVWENLPAAGDDGVAYEYTVDENPVPDGYVKLISEDGLTVYNLKKVGLTIQKIATPKTEAPFKFELNLLNAFQEPAPEPEPALMQAQEAENGPQATKWPQEFELDDDGKEGTDPGNKLDSLKAFPEIEPGTYRITEKDIPAGWELADLSCYQIVGEETKPLEIEKGENYADVPVEPGQAVRCVFRNSTNTLGAIVTDKVTWPAKLNLASPFNFVTTGDGYVSFELTDEDEPNRQPLLPGAYSVTEDEAAAVLNGSYLLYAVCESNIPDKEQAPGAIALENGEMVTCTFHNTVPGSIGILKSVVNPYDEFGEFEFLSSLRGLNAKKLKPGQLNVVQVDATDHGRLAPDTQSWVVSEIVPGGWKLADIQCREIVPEWKERTTYKVDIKEERVLIQPHLTEGEMYQGVTLCEFVNSRADWNPPEDDEHYDPPVPGKEIPRTGFSVGRVTALPEQTAAKLYASTGLTLRIPAMQLEVPIVGVPESETGWDLTWLDDQAGWLAGSAFPTWQGNTVLTAHVWDASDQPGPFAALKSLRYGDTFTITAYGSMYTYEIRSNDIIGAKDLKKLLKHENQDWVTLVTCEDYNPQQDKYTFRRMVRAVLIGKE